MLSYNGTCFEFKKDNGKTLTLKPTEFWKLVVEAEKHDIRSEVREYISGCQAGFSEEEINRIADKVHSRRIERESGDDIYDAIVELFGKKRM